MFDRWLNKINIIFAFGLAIVLAMGCVSYISNSKLNIFYGLVTHTDKVLENVKSTLSLFQDIETGERGYVITGKEEFLEPYNNGVAQINESLESLEKLTRETPAQQMRVGQLKELKKVILSKTQSVVASRHNQGTLAASNLVTSVELKNTMDDIRGVVAAIESEARELLTERGAEVSRYSMYMSRVIVFGSFTAVGLVLIAIFILNREMNRRITSEQTVQHLNFQLVQKVSELETSNKELESFSYSVSHDLRAPLRTMIGFSTIILEDHGDTLPAEVKINLNRVISATHKMGQLIDGLLDLSRLTRTELISENVNLSTLADSILKDFRGSDPKRNVSFETTKDLVVRGDSRLLQAALFNLLSNAWKFTRTCKEARIEFGIKSEKNRKIYFVRDNGAGFDMTYSNKLFGVFQRLHSSQEYEGTGIGLATVQRIIQRHGGKIWVESEINKGTTFYFTV